jgi:hypothetical protein
MRYLCMFTIHDSLWITIQQQLTAEDEAVEASACTASLHWLIKQQQQ